MTAFAGSALYAQWVWSGGTTVLSGDYRTLNVNQSMEFIDSTAGADTYREKIASFSDIQATWTSVMQTGATALFTATAAGVTGTLTVGPSGTATGQPKIIMPSVSQGPSINASYSDIVEFSATFQGSSAPTFSGW